MSSLELLFLHNAAMRKEKTKSIWDSRHYVDGYRQNPDYRQEIVFLKQYENQKFLLKKKDSSYGIMENVVELKKNY